MSGLLERFARRRRTASGVSTAPHSQPENGPRPASSDASVGLYDATNGGGDGTYPSASGEPEATNHAAGTNGSVPIGSAPEPPAALPPPEPWVPAEGPAAHRPAAAPQSPAQVAEVPKTPADEIPEPDPDPPSSAPGFRERGRLRRRARYLRQVREIQLRDIGGLTLELHRFGRERRDLVQAKVADAAGTDAELRGLERVLDGEASIRELREAGIGGACDACGALHGSMDRYCASCGEPIGAGHDAKDETDAANESSP